MVRERTRRRIRVCTALAFSLSSAYAGPGRASAAEIDALEGDASTAACPTTEAVWASVSALVPEAAALLAAAKPRVDIDDLGGRYRVHVVTSKETLVRDYVDPAHDCAKRARFAAEFIILALMPPQIASSAGLTAPAPRGVTSSEPKPPVPANPPATASSAPAVAANGTTHASPRPRSAAQRATEEPPDPTAVRRPTTSAPSAEERAAPRSGEAGAAAPDGARAVMRFELSGTLALAPPLEEGPTIVSWGAQLRTQIGRGPIAGVFGVGYWPAQILRTAAFEGSLLRVPASAGIRVEAIRRAIEVDIDVTVSAALERYEGLSPKSPAHASRITPGVDAAVVARPAPLLGFAPFVAIQGSWCPLRQALVATPRLVGETPSVWLLVAAGASYGR